MSDAFQCDLCGVLFQARRCDCFLITRREPDDYDTKEEIDLCPPCFASFKEWRETRKEPKA